jgi:hypothetical protein
LDSASFLNSLLRKINEVSIVFNPNKHTVILWVKNSCANAFIVSPQLDSDYRCIWNIIIPKLRKEIFDNVGDLLIVATIHKIFCRMLPIEII